MIKAEYLSALKEAEIKAVAAEAVAHDKVCAALEVARKCKADPSYRHIASEKGSEAYQARREAKEAKEARASARRVVLGSIAAREREAAEQAAQAKALAVRPLKPPPRPVSDD